MREVLSDARLYIVYWATKNKDINTNSLNAVQLDYVSDVRQYNLSNEDQKPIKGIMKYLLECAVFEYLQQQPSKQRKAISEKFKCDKENLEPLRSWIKAVTGKVEDDDLYIMAHWLWLVKRNSLELPVVHHIMPIITSSKQGGGKSTAVQNLIAPYEQLILELKVPQVVDERSFTMFSECLIGFFDEMAGADKVEISDFKRNVTSSTIAYRPMRTNSIVKLRNLCSFIGASNNQVYEIIKDTTGIRRFFPIQALDLLDHALINTIDYNQLWKGIDETLSRGYFEKVKETVAQKQEDMSMKDEVFLFLEDHNILPNSETTSTINGKELYNAYIVHTKNCGIRFPVAAQTFYKKLRDMGIQGAKKLDENRNRAWFFAINAEHGLKFNKEKIQ